MWRPFGIISALGILGLSFSGVAAFMAALDHGPALFSREGLNFSEGGLFFVLAMGAIFVLSFQFVVVRDKS